ncbi:hypothetical protein [Sphingobium yanoikuyae]|uniref:hypothetical protein n=1 Tax=Sphingobium yanoikuyae TaxID=13690 RepID=UPI0028B0034B|nr:hypothetical protein [Sphingobium yanoikuyae]
MDKVTANAALAFAAMNVAGAGMSAVPETYADISTRLVDEAKLKLGISVEDQSPDSMERVRSFLAAEVNRRVFDGVDRNAVRSRLGAQGRLSNGAYKMSFAENFSDFKESERFVRDCIVSADDTCHLVPMNEGNDKEFSIFSKKVSSLNRKRSYWAIALCFRQGSELKVVNFWRLFDQTVDVLGSENALDLLSSFLDVYGIPLVINDVQTSDKMITNRQFFGDLSIGVKRQPGVSGRIYQIFRRTLSGSFEVPLAFAVNFSEYLRDKAKLA